MHGAEIGKRVKKEINIAGRNYQVKKELSEMTSQPKSTAEMYKTLYIVFANAEQIERIESFSYADKFNLKGDDGKQKETLEQIQNEFYEKFPDGTMESRMLSRSSFYELYGGLFFIGIYLGSMFIMATVLIIYYKQISEGYDDRERYQIMQNFCHYFKGYCNMDHCYKLLFTKYILSHRISPQHTNICVLCIFHTKGYRIRRRTPPCHHTLSSSRDC